MATVMEMPKLSDTMKEGAISRWLFKEGDKVQSGLPIVEIETDKATMEFESPASGLLLKIIVGDSGTCALNAPIAVIGKTGENWQEALETYEKKKSGKGVAKVTSQTTPSSSGAASSPNPSPQPSSSLKLTPLQGTNFGIQAGLGNRIKASPLAKKIANEKGIVLENIVGTGPNGRIISQDLLNATSGAATAKVTSSFGQTIALQPTKIPISMMRKTIATRLTESWQSNPCFFLTVSINMGPLLSWKKSIQAKHPEQQKYSVSDILGFLVARALKKHPTINSSWAGDHIIQYPYVHLGFAVALPNGLVTPVLRNADTISLTDLTLESKQLVKLAKEGKLTPDQYSGGTFTISNLGMQGIEEFTAIINPPQAAILAIGSTIATPVVGPDGQFISENRMKVTLSCDHRVIDGFVGSEFLKTLKLYIEDPASALFFG